jgi:hypothetical protein
MTRGSWQHCRDALKLEDRGRRREQEPEERSSLSVHRDSLTERTSDSRGASLARKDSTNVSIPRSGKVAQPSPGGEG